MGSGVATGENRAVEAANAAISSPLLEGVSISGAQGVLVNITGGKNMSLVEVDEATSIIHEAAGDDANVILGAVIDESMTEEIMVTVIATGFNRKGSAVPRPAKNVRVLDHIPTGVQDLKKMDEPAYIRKGFQLPTASMQPAESRFAQPTTDRDETDKPAFLRKIMD